MRYFRCHSYRVAVIYLRDDQGRGKPSPYPIREKKPTGQGPRVGYPARTLYGRRNPLRIGYGLGLPTLGPCPGHRARICAALPHLARREMRLKHLVPLVNAQRPGSGSPHFPGKQGTFLLHSRHEEALRRSQGLNSHRAQLPVHTRRGRTLPQTPAEACIKASNGNTAQRLR